MSLLVKLIEADGGVFTERSGTQWKLRCFMDDHEDKTPSMSVDVSRGFFHCFGCGASGTTYDYLAWAGRTSSGCGKRGLGKKEAIKYLVDIGEWTDKKVVHDVQHSEKIVQERNDKAGGLPPHTSNIYQKHRNLDLSHLYDYCDENGRLILRVARYDGLDKVGKPSKSFRQYTPAKRGGWWMANPMRDDVPTPDRTEKLPLYNLAELRSSADLTVLFVEGEKCVHAVKDTPFPGGREKPFVATCVAGGSSTKIVNFDLTPLSERSVVIVADADKAGRKFAGKIGAMLGHYNAKCKYVLPGGETHYDIADCLAQGGWRATADWMKTNASSAPPNTVEVKPSDKRRISAPELADDGEFPDDGGPVGPHPLQETDHFRVLGMDQSGTSVMFLKKKTNLLLQVQARSLGSEGNLTLLAPLDFWRSLTEDGGWTSTVRITIADGLLRAAESIGVADEASLNPKGRGASMTDSGAIFNLGDCFWTGIKDGKFTQKQPLEMSPVLLESGPRMIMLNDLTQAERWARAFADSLMEYRFQTPIDARRFLGWLVTSLIGGALKFRPMAWLTAPSKSGKTFLRQDVMSAFFGGFMIATDDQTAAGIAQVARNQSLPVLMDEFEPEEQNEKSWKSILALIRSSSGGDGQRVRGTLSGQAVATTPRFSTMVFSISKPDLSEADASRLVPIKLSGEGVLDWIKVRNDIWLATDKERMDAVRSWTIMHTPKILSMIKERQRQFETVEGMDTRSILIHSALTVGAQWLSGVDTSTWMPFEAGLDRNYELLKHLFATRVRVAGNVDITIAALLRKVKNLDNAKNKVDGEFSKWADFCEQFGLRTYYDDIRAKDVLLVAYETPALQKLLSGSAFGRHVSVRENLMQIQGVYPLMNDSGKRKRVRFSAQQRVCIAIPEEVLSRAGLDVVMLFGIPEEEAKHMEDDDDPTSMEYIDV